MILGTLASNGKKMNPVWFELGYRLTSVYKKVWRRKFFEFDHVFQQNGAPAHKAKTVQDWLYVNMSFCGPHSLPSTLACGRTLRKRLVRHATTNTDELKVYVYRARRAIWEGFFRKVCKNFRPRLERVSAVKSGHIKFFNVFVY